MKQPLQVSRRSFLRHTVILGVMAASGWAMAGCASSTSPAEPRARERLIGLTPDQAQDKLREGNDRFVALRSDPNISEARRLSLASGQHPFAGIIGCIDSRVPPELVFDRGLGDLFVGRVGAAIADDSQVGGMEFGVLEFDLPLLVVLGHGRCGAVTAAVEAMEKGDTPPGEIGAVVGPILPAIEAAKLNEARHPDEPVDLIDQSVRESVHISVAALQRSPVLAGRIAAGKLKVVGARYDLNTGRVEYLSPRSARSSTDQPGLGFES
jgi:carbonic anhydrase